MKWKHIFIWSAIVLHIVLRNSIFEPVWINVFNSTKFNWNNIMYFCIKCENVIYIIYIPNMAKRMKTRG